MNISNRSSISNQAPMAFVQHNILLVELNLSSSAASLVNKLSAQNMSVLTVLNSPSGLVDQVQETQPNVLLLSSDFLDAMTLDQLAKVNQCCPLPVIVLVEQHAPEVLKAVVAAGISSYVVDDVQAQRLPVIIDLAIERFNQIQILNTELKITKEKLSERKLIEKAKGILMQQKHLSEDQAYSQMRRSAMNQGQSMAELSKRIISVFEILN